MEDYLSEKTREANLFKNASESSKLYATKVKEFDALKQRREEVYVELSKSNEKLFHIAVEVAKTEIGKAREESKLEEEASEELIKALHNFM